VGGAYDDQDDPQAGTDAEAAAASTAIAGLRWRLRRQSTLEHPAVRRELRKLDEQLAARLERAGSTPGRHRFPGGRAPSRPESGLAEDTDESDLRPDPDPARTTQELVTIRGQ
jgi:hypothetical protein